MNQQYFHSVELDAELCCGCTNCLKRCPTEAIRIRDGKGDRCGFAAGGTLRGRLITVSRNIVFIERSCLQ